MLSNPTKQNFNKQIDQSIVYMLEQCLISIAKYEYVVYSKRFGYGLKIYELALMYYCE